MSVDQKKKNVIIACGGTAGHIFPGLTLAGAIERRCGGSVAVSFITSDNGLAQKLLKASGYNFYTLPVKGMKKRSLFGNIGFMASLFAGAARSMRIVFKEKPDCLVAFGSYISGAPFAAASLLGIPTIIHEQNVMMGRANRIMRRFATKVALSFPETLGPKNNNIVITGNPVREEASKKYGRETALGLLGMTADKFTLLIMGGSQGSRRLNSITADVLKDMDMAERRRIQVLHIAGEEDYGRLKEIYEDIKDIPYRIYPFFNDMGLLYSAADAVLSRAGASAIFEFCAHKIPSILVPYPFAEGHQVKNARFLSDRRAAMLLKEADLSMESLRKAVRRLLEDSDFRETMKKNLEDIEIPEAADILAAEVSLLTGLGGGRPC